jgi:AP-2 complex subunit alpha
MLGYEVDFGHLEFISLMSSTKFQEKSVGYMALALMLRSGDELMTLVVNSMRNDIIGQLHHGQTLALSAVANIGGADLAEALAADVQRLIVSPLDASTHSFHSILPPEVVARNKSLICKKASLCLLKLFRTNPDCVVLEEWMKRLSRLLEDRDLGVITSVMSLLLGFASHSPNSFESLVPYVISILTRLVINRTCPTDYLYYRIPCPWLQVKCLRFLQYYKIPDAAQMELLNDVLSKILVKTDVSESHNKSNADHSILFEAINLVLSYGVEAPSFLKEHTCSLLGFFFFFVLIYYYYLFFFLRIICLIY